MEKTPQQLVLSFLAMFALLASFVPAWAAAPSPPSYDISSDLPISPIEALTLEEIPLEISFAQIREKQADWERKSTLQSLSGTGGAYWYWFRLENPGERGGRAIVSIDEVFPEITNFYVVSNSGVRKIENGLKVPIRHRTIGTRVPAIDIYIEPGEHADVYIQLTSKFTASIGITAHKPAGFAKWVEWQSIGYAFFFGASIAIIIYNLFLYATVQQVIYLVYALHAICVTLFVARFSGFDLYIIDDVDNHYALSAITWVQAALMIQFSRMLLDTNQMSRWLDRLLVIAMILFVGIAALTVYDVYFYRVGIAAAMPLLAVMFFIGLRSAYSGNPLGLLYTFAQTTYLIGNFLIAGLSLGLLSYTWLNRYGFIIGSLVELVTFSLALGYRLRLAEQASLSAQKSLVELGRSQNERLQAQVAERTADLRMASDRLKRTNQDYATLLNNVDMGVFGLDNTNHINFINKAGAAVLNHHPELKENIEDLLKQQTLKSTLNEITTQRSDGVKGNFLLTIAKREAPPGAWVVVADVTDIRNREAMINQNQKLATLGEMSTGMAHELNQPLQVIRLALANIKRQLQREPVVVEKLKSKAETIDEQVERAARLIRHMRTYGRISTSEFTPFNVHDCIDRMIELWTEQLRLLDINLEVEIAAHEVMVNGSEGQFDQVLMNLIANAKDAVLNHSVPGFVKIALARTPTEVTITVSDSGGGVPAEVIEKVFEPFFTTKPVGQGTGLGGSISYGIVKDMDGELQVTNDDHGAVFTITLPIYNP